MSKTINLDATGRLLLVRELPDTNMSLTEARKTQQLRRTLMFTDDEKEIIGWEESGRGIKLDNPEGLDEIDTQSFVFDDDQLHVVAEQFLIREEENNVPNADEWLDLYDKFADVVEKKRENEE